MKKAHIFAISALILVTAPASAAAQQVVSTPPTTPTPREVPFAAEAHPATATASLRVERNSPTLLFTGVGLVLTGLGGLGGGYAGNVVGRRDCESDARSATRGIPSVVEGAAAYEVVYSRCANTSDAIAGGTAAMIAGGAFAAIGTVFIVAGAWRVTVPIPVKSAMVPKVDLGPSSLGLRWAF